MRQKKLALFSLLITRTFSLNRKTRWLSVQKERCFWSCMWYMESKKGPHRGTGIVEIFLWSIYFQPHTTHMHEHKKAEPKFQHIWPQCLIWKRSIVFRRSAHCVFSIPFIKFSFDMLEPKPSAFYHTVIPTYKSPKRTCCKIVDFKRNFSDMWQISHTLFHHTPTTSWSCVLKLDATRNKHFFVHFSVSDTDTISDTEETINCARTFAQTVTSLCISPKSTRMQTGFHDLGCFLL